MSLTAWLKKLVSNCLSILFAFLVCARILHSFVLAKNFFIYICPSVWERQMNVFVWCPEFSNDSLPFHSQVNNTHIQTTPPSPEDMKVIYKLCQEFLEEMKPVNAYVDHSVPGSRKRFFFHCSHDHRKRSFWRISKDFLMKCESATFLVGLDSWSHG